MISLCIFPKMTQEMALREVSCVFHWVSKPHCHQLVPNLQVSLKVWILRFLGSSWCLFPLITLENVHFMFTSPRVVKYFFSSCNLEIPFLVVLLLFLRRKLAHNRGTCWFFRNQPGRTVDWICLKHFLISSLCVLFLSNVTWPPQQRFNCGNLGPLQTWVSWMFFWNLHNWASFRWKTGNILKVTWCIIGLETTSHFSSTRIL